MSDVIDPVQAAAQLLADALRQAQAQQAEPQPVADLQGSELDDLPPLLAVAKAAKLLGISRASAYRYAKSGELPATRLGGRVLIKRDDLRSLLGRAA